MLAYHILDNFKKCDVTLKNGVTILEVPDVIFLPFAELVEYDVIGGLFDFDGHVFFIPWNNVINLQISEG